MILAAHCVSTLPRGARPQREAAKRDVVKRAPAAARTNVSSTPD